MKELIKVASVLYSAMKSNTENETESGEESGLPTFDIGSKLAELKQTRQLGSSITMKGAQLYDLLGREVELREKRQAVLARLIFIRLKSEKISLTNLYPGLLRYRRLRLASSPLPRRWRRRRKKFRTISRM